VTENAIRVVIIDNAKKCWASSRDVAIRLSFW
jgi:hypothetical protein